MKGIYLRHFHAIKMHSVEDKDHKNPVAINEPILINQMKIRCLKKDECRVTGLGWLSRLYSNKLTKWYCPRCFGGKFSKLPLFWISLCSVLLLFGHPFWKLCTLFWKHTGMQSFTKAHAGTQPNSGGACLPAWVSRGYSCQYNWSKMCRARLFCTSKKAFKNEMFSRNGQHQCKLQPFFKHNSKHNIL